MHKICVLQKSYTSLLKTSTFEWFDINLSTILKVNLKLLNRECSGTSTQISIRRKTVVEIIEKFHGRIPVYNFSDKFGSKVLLCK